MNNETSVAERKTRGGRLGLVLGIGLLASLMTYASISADSAPKVAPDKSAGPVASARGVGSGVPLQINHQGVVQSGGIRFNGTGLFRFAIVDPDTGNQVWTNDGTNVPGPGTPAVAVSVSVVNGVYSVGLGDVALPNMTAIPSTIFNDDNVVLRIWFDDGSNGVQQLTPDHPLSTSPYSFKSASATTAIDADTVDGFHAADLIATQPPIGSIIAWHKNLTGVPALPGNWLECNGQVVSDAASPMDGQALPNLNGEARFIRGSATSGDVQNATAVPVIAEFSVGAIFIGNQGDVTMTPFSDQDAVIPSSPAGRRSIGMSPNDAANPRTRAVRVRPINMSMVWIMRVK